MRLLSGRSSRANDTSIGRLAQIDTATPFSSAAAFSRSRLTPPARTPERSGPAKSARGASRARAAPPKDPSSTDLLYWALLGCVLFVAFRYCASVTTVIAQRWDYAFELEWMEGGMLHHAMRVLQGKELYPEPGPEFMPFLYTPLYHWLGAAFVRVSQTGLPALRALSLLSTLTSLSLIGLIVWRVTRRSALTVFAPVLLLSTFSLNGYWFDIARVDMLALALSLGSLVLLLFEPSSLRLAICGAAVGLAFLTKQSSLALLPALGLFVFHQRGLRGALSFSLPALVIVGGTTLWQNGKSQGWYWYYTMILPSTHGMKNREHLLLDFWKDELLLAAPTLTCVAALLPLVLFLNWKTRQKERPQYLLVSACGILLILGSYITRLHMGSYTNDLIPAHVGLILLACLTCSQLAAGWPAVEDYSALVFAAHFWWLPPISAPDLVPTKQDVAAGERLVERIRSSPGPVLVVNHPHYAILAQKDTWTHQMAMIDVYYADRDPRELRDLLRRKWAPLFEQRYFHEVIEDNDWYVFQEELKRSYRPHGQLPQARDALLPKTGTPLRPDVIWRPAVRAR